MLFDQVPNSTEPLASFRREIHTLNADLRAHRNYGIGLPQIVAKRVNGSI